MELNFEIDKITESIENADTGETLDTLVLPVTQDDLEEVRRAIAENKRQETCATEAVSA